jgi:hypothetical protein
MLYLENIDLININCVDPIESSKVLDLCTKQIKFNKSILFTDKQIDSDHEIQLIDPITNIEQYSDFCLSLTNYIDNEFVLIVQNDGFILNGNKWNNDFLKYDYIGAPWMQTKVIGQKVGNGGFSLRSKKFLDFSNLFQTTNSEPEDNFLCLTKYYEALQYGCVYAPSNVASNFAYEYPHNLSDRFNLKDLFGFHGKHNLFEAYKHIKNMNI